MAPTISTTSKFTPSPRKKILGEKNDVTQARASIEFKSEALTLDQTLKDVDSDPHLPPYHPKPRFLRYKPNPRIEILLNKEGDNDDVTRVEESFNLSEEQEQQKEKEAELGDDLVNGSSRNLPELVLEEKQFDLEVEKLSKPRFAAFAKESFDDLVETVKQLKSHFIPTHKIKSLQFEEEIQEFEEEIQDFDDEVVTEEPIHEPIQSDDVDVQETKSNLDEAIHEVQSEMMENDVEIESSFTDFNEESEASSSLLTQSITTICVVAGFFMVGMVVSTVLYMNQNKSNASKSATIRVNNNNMRRESLASSSSDFSMGSPSLGSFTTYERIAIKHKDEAMLTPIQRSSRLLKNQANV
ncbi:hypothetical protein L1987_70866 [Smallanthus sonchifolius]|uniref:Uncharacterized protein n=1 Tax=Smallanthus sonchifolius TaxID=185202 RepID=A0ACB9AV60_9ASTR|nr:hypothetical protein L1987_70866 [Smallanthus sonchifolius]